jgi:hypothetical protein
MSPGGIAFNREMFLNIPLLTDFQLLRLSTIIYNEPTANVVSTTINRAMNALSWITRQPVNLTLVLLGHLSSYTRMWMAPLPSNERLMLLIV